jgi:indolepyruvate ferredoxin oxidoreductase
MPADMRLLTSQGREVFLGNELLVKGCLETEGGVHLLTGYPGSPVSGFFDSLSDIKDTLSDHGVRAFQANNEALAAASLNGSQMLACRGVLVMKSVGLHVAADALALGNLAGCHPQGGAIVICGDDPFCESTQVPADSRYLLQHLRMAVVEPGTPQELKDWIDLSFRLSRAAGLFVGYVVTTAQADGGGTAQCRPNQYPELNTRRKTALNSVEIELDKVLLPPRTWQHELAMPERFARTMVAARELGLNRIIPATTASPGGAPLGFIVTGMAGPYLQQALAEAGLAGHFPILQMGLSYPADARLVREFAEFCSVMIVIEERRGFLEMNIRDSLFQELPHDQATDLSSRLFGKRFPVKGSGSRVQGSGTEKESGIRVLGSGRLEPEPRTLNPESSRDENTEYGIPAARGLNYSILAQALIPLIQSVEDLPSELRNGRLTQELSRLRGAGRAPLAAEGTEAPAAVADIRPIPRTPTFCPGCPHRDSSAVLLDLRKNLADPAYMKRTHNLPPVDLIAHGDTGCYTMFMFAPTEQLMHNYSGMGLGAGTGSGIDPFITNKQIVFMGDSTFFHSGQLAISNSVKAGQDITYIILENGTTAMTGHQDHAAIAEDMFGNRHPIIDIHNVVAAMARTAPIGLYKANPADRGRYTRLLEKAILAPGVKVVIADKECGITYHRKVMRQEKQIVRAKGFLPYKTHMNITPEVCEHCLECALQTSCPGLTLAETDYGPKVDTDLTWCVNDGACERVRVSNEAGVRSKPCPSFEQVTIVRSHRRRYLLPRLSLDKLPDPEQYAVDLSAPGASWRCHMSGVGGMGIGVACAILVRAGHKEGYRIIFQEKKGLAVRNGSVFAQVTFVKDAELSPRPSPGVPGEGAEGSFENPESKIENPYTGSIPYGKADLLLGVDVLEAARAVDARAEFRVADRQNTCAVLNLYKQPTVSALLGKADFVPADLERRILSLCRSDLSYAKDLSEICEQRLGSKQFVNILMLGVAFQLGLIPVSAHSIAWAIKDTIKREHRRNLKAFNIGRKLALEPRALPAKPEPRTWDQLLTNKGKIIRRTRLFGPKHAANFERLVNTAMRLMPLLPESAKYDITLRIYDLMHYQDERLARRYIHLIRGVYKRDSSSRAHAATVAAIWNLAKVMLIKDEIYVSHLLTRFEKKHRDILKYGVDVANGDRLVYRHHTKPEFNLGPWRIRLNLTTTDWMLWIVAHCKLLRKLPGWHRRERTFRDWYVTLLDRIDLSTPEQYERSLAALKCPEPVTGYREIRYPKIDAARKMAEEQLGVQAALPVQNPVPVASA